MRCQLSFQPFMIEQSDVWEMRKIMRRFSSCSPIFDAINTDYVAIENVRKRAFFRTFSATTRAILVVNSQILNCRGSLEIFGGCSNSLPRENAEPPRFEPWSTLGAIIDCHLSVDSTWVFLFRVTMLRKGIYLCLKWALRSWMASGTRRNHQYQ